MKQKQIERLIIDDRNKKAYMVHLNKTRKNRGYSFEADCVNRFNETQGWFARRLGGSSTGLPDVMATSDNGFVISMECKSTRHENNLYIPQDQIERCVFVLKLFQYYPRKNIIFGFKFGQSKGRKKKEYFFNGNGFSWESSFRNVEWVKCTREGEFSIKWQDGFKPADNQIDPPISYPMPFSQLINLDYRF